MKSGIRKDCFQKIRLLAWPEEQRAAFLRVLVEVYEADGGIAPEELAELRKDASLLGVPPDAVDRLPLEEALARLRPAPKRMELLHAWIADALFADGVFDEREQRLAERLVGRYGLDAPLLELRIGQARSREIEKIFQNLLDPRPKKTRSPLDT
jgi:uncharacterized tellurite resistance protein B-like protein